MNDSETKTLQLLYLVKLDKIDNKFINVVKDDIPKISSVIDLYYQKHLDFKSKVKQVKQSISKDS